MFFVISFGLLFISVYFLIRSEIVFMIKTRALIMAGSLARQAIDCGDLNWARYYRMYDEKSYIRLLFGFCWTVKQAYPQLYKEYGVLLHG